MIINKLRQKIYKSLSERNKERASRFFKRLKLNGFFYKNRIAAIRRMLHKGEIADLNRYEQMFFSQNGEDGIIRAIFDTLGTTNKHCVEFGIEPGEGNTYCLKKRGWQCLWMDANGDDKIVKKEFITAENIEKLFKKYRLPREFDLLSIDIDRNDYWVWKAIKKYSPRVIVIEYNSSIPPNQSKVVKYAATTGWDGTNYFGASLLAYKKLGEAKGYTLVACDSNGVNAFFVRNDLIKGNFKKKNIGEIYRPPRYGEIVDGTYTGHPPSKKRMMIVR